MHTYTTRSEPTNTFRILTLTPAFEAQFRDAHPWAAWTVLAALLEKTCSRLDLAQAARLEFWKISVPAIGAAEQQTLNRLLAQSPMLDTGVLEALVRLNAAVQQDGIPPCSRSGG